MRTFAIIPAAGLSVRMGRPKLSLPLGDSNILQCVIATLRAGGIDDVIVVLGPASRGQESEVSDLGALACVLALQTPDMAATVRGGLEWLNRKYGPHDEDAWLLVPADHPALDVKVVRALLAARKEHLESSIFVPIHEGRRGHPTLCAWKHAETILRSRWDQGLNVYFRQHAAETFEHPWPTPEILWDLDTADDYHCLLQWYRETNSGH